jgi:hypothetical protein
MNDLNILSILYLSFRLAPVILVSLFSLSSIFNQDLKGLIYLAGLIFACFITIITGNLLPDKWLLGKPSSADPITQSINRVCNIMTLTKAGPISKLPLSQTVFTFTFGYLLYIIVKYHLVNQNIPTLVIFPVLIVSDWLWNTMNSCSKPIALISATVIGGLVGVAWGAIIDSSNMTNLQYFNGISSNETCSVPSKQTFKCVIKGKSKGKKESFKPMNYNDGKTMYPINKKQEDISNTTNKTIQDTKGGNVDASKIKNKKKQDNSIQSSQINNKETGFFF